LDSGASIDSLAASGFLTGKPGPSFASSVNPYTIIGSNYSSNFVRPVDPGDRILDFSGDTKFADLGESIVTDPSVKPPPLRTWRIKQIDELPRFKSWRMIQDQRNMLGYRLGDDMKASLDLAGIDTDQPTPAIESDDPVLAASSVEDSFDAQFLGIAASLGTQVAYSLQAHRAANSGTSTGVMQASNLNAMGNSISSGVAAGAMAGSLLDDVLGPMGTIGGAIVGGIAGSISGNNSASTYSTTAGSVDPSNSNLPF